MSRFYTWLAALTVVVAGSLAGCAQDVGDIDRTQPNKLKKENFEGTWYVRHTVVDAPPTSNVFVGISSSMEKVRWEIQENYLIAYRTYPKVPGYDKKAGKKDDGQTQFKGNYEEGRSKKYTEEPIAMYPIKSHFDVQRKYNPKTGEPTNVVVENKSDRPWYKREYMRVDWTKNLVAFSLPNQLNGSNPAKYYSQANQGGPDAFYDEHGDVDDDSSSELSYFDFTVKVSANPCFSRERQAQGSTGVCSRGQRFPGRVSHPGQAEVEIRSSFSRIKHGRRDYQPVYYGDEKMTKFGFFRTNRPVYDKRKGFTDEGAIRLANRFDIWKNDFKRTEDGSFEEDAAGHRIPVPMPERKPKPVVYHLSPDFPDSLMPSAQKIESDYNKAFKRVVAAAKYGVDDPSKVDQKMFYVCQNPVPKDAPEACDPRPLDKRVGSDGTYEPYRARPGDLRRNFIYLVREPAAGGLLGFGPSFADPETGEIISGTAYVYGAAVNRKADEAVNVVKLLNDDLSREAAYEGEDIENYIRNHLKQGIDPRANMGKEMFSKLKNIGLDQLDEALLDKGQRQRLRQLRQSNWKERLKVPSNFQSKQYEELQKHGFDQLVLNDELIWGMSGGQVPPNRQKVSAKKVRKLLKKQNPFKPSSILHSEQQPWKQYARQNMYHEDFMFGAVFGLAKEYDKKNVDYQKVYNEIRNEVFRGVMVHELGHTVGLRHNFAGSYDSVNYHDEYWNMRKQNFGIPNSLAGFWEKSNMTEKQRKGEMPKYMYSSIMDYHSRFNGDMAGLGKYDVAALRFAYTTGTYSNVKASNRDPIPTKAGYVEVFKDVPKSVNLPQYQSPRKPRQIMYSYDDRYAPWEHPLTDYHYTSLVKMLGGVENLDDRELMRYSKLRKKQKNNVEGRPVEVQYMMCSDEYAGFSVDCNPWDLGAGPFEITKWAVRKYEDYYPFTHFRRDRLDFGINSALRSSSRVFRQFPNIYQRWILHRFRSFRNDDSDQILTQYFTFGALAGLNQLKDVLTKPTYGAYVETKNDDGESIYQLVDRTKTCEQGREFTSNGQTFRVTCVDPGPGRTKNTRYDRGSGYYYYQRPTEIGHFWDYLVAMSALSASQTRVIGENTTERFFSFTIPYTLVFRDSLTELVNGLFRENYSKISPILTRDGKLVQRPLVTLQAGGQSISPLTGEQVPEMGSSSSNTGAITSGKANPVNTRLFFSERFQTFLQAIQFFDTRFSQKFVNQSRVFKVGNGEQITAPKNGDFEKVTFTDPGTGVTYGAIHDKSGSDDSLAVDLVQNGAKLAEKYKNATGDGQRREIRRSLDDTVREVNIIADAVNLLGSPLR